MNIPPKLSKHKIAGFASSPAHPSSSASNNPSSKSPAINNVHSSVATRNRTEPEQRNNNTQGESLPVLESFHNFIEVESKRHRRNVTLLACFFIMLMLLISGGTFILLRQMSRDYRDVRGSVNKMESDAQQWAATIKKISNDANAIKASISERESKISNEQKELSTGITEQKSVIDKINNMLKPIETDNAQLKNDIAALKAQQNAGPRKEIIQATEDKSQEERTTSQEVSEQTQVVNTTSSKRHTPIELKILPKGEKQSVTWQIPVME